MVMTAQQQATILNVDDYEPGRYSRSRILKSAGFDVLEATTGHEALHLVRTRRPQLVLLDVNLPDITGFEVCRQIKQDPSTSHVLVLQMSATSITLESKLTGLAAGSDGYLTEPVHPEELVANVNALLRLKRAEEAVREVNATLRAVVEASPLAVIATDAEGLVVRWSPAAERIFGWREEEVIGRPLPLVPAARQEEFRSRLEMTLAGRSETGFETERLRKDGSLVPVSLSTAPLRAATGEVTGTLAIFEDITERKRAEAEMARLYTEANRAGRVKDEFLATLSHELRTPMNAMSVWVHLLRRGEVPADRLDYALEVIERNTTAQVRLIEDILDVSRIVSGKLRLQAHLVDVSKVVHAATEMVRPAAADKNVTLAVSVSSGAAVVRGDAQRLQQVVTNLLSNAVKFTPPEGRVELALHIRGNTAVIEVADSGVGIDPQFLPRVFERFTQADSTTSRSHGGLGLGLAIVRHLVEAHRGSVAAESRGAGQGSTFRVTLPLAAEEEVASSFEEGDDQDRVALTDIKVLVVDDERDARDLLQVLLTARGAVVWTARSVAEALPVFTAERPDVVIADIGMPGEDGYRLLDRLRTIDPAMAFHAIAVSGYVSEEDRSRARAAGFHGHLAKPIEIATLMTTIARAVSSKRS
jgi:PAS domain S-box-containing protein